MNPSPVAARHPLPQGGEGLNSIYLSPRPFGGEGPGARAACHFIV